MLDVKRLRVLREVAQRGSFSAAGEDELEAIAGLRGGRVRLASFPTAGATLVPLAIAELSRRHPAIELSLMEAETEEVLPRLKAGELDVALIFEYSSLSQGDYETAREDIERIHLLDDPMYVALPPDHPLARKRTLRLEDLAGESWVQGDCNGSCGAM